MTILESTEKLLEWFAGNDSFNASNDKHYETLLNKSETNIKSEEKAAVIGALDELVNSNMLRKATVLNNDYYILTRSLESCTQNVPISPITTLIVTEILKEYSEIIKNKNILPNPLQLTESDILTALTILKGACNQTIEQSKPNKKNERK